MKKQVQYIARDISWLSFNGRVLQEAADASNSLTDRLKFLGIFSNNLDEFYRVRVATQQRLLELQKNSKINQKRIIDTLYQIKTTTLQQQEEFSEIWQNIVSALAKHKVYFKHYDDLNEEQEKFVAQYFDEEVESNVIPLMIQNIKEFPQLREKSLYLAVAIAKKNVKNSTKYALIEVPVRYTPRFVLLPSPAGQQHIILLEDVMRHSLPRIFSMFSVNHFTSHIIKFTRDAELDIDNDITTNLIQKLEKGLKQRKLARPVRFIYDRTINPALLGFLIKKLSLTIKDNLMPGDSIHNFRHFMEFPFQVIKQVVSKHKPFHHPLLENAKTVTQVVLKQDVLLHFPYHSFDGVIDMLREAAISPDVTEIKITAYRLASQSKVINTLINAAKNGKKVFVVLELKARFDEEANLFWKNRLEDEGIKVHIGVPNLKVHAKLCLIKKVTKKTVTHYGFVSTGNLNEKTAKVYSDTCLLTSNRFIMADCNRVFTYLLGNVKNTPSLLACKKFMVSPVSMRSNILTHIATEIKNHKLKKTSGIIIKLNSLTDIVIINKLYEAANQGVQVQLIIRSIFCMPILQKPTANLTAISIVDGYLEHSRILYFNNANNPKVYISSADCMGRNLDHRVEVACPIENPLLKNEIYEILQLQLADNTKARILNVKLNNTYKSVVKGAVVINSQQQIAQFLKEA